MRTLFVLLLVAGCDATSNAKAALDATGGMRGEVDVLKREVDQLRAQLGAMDDMRGSVLLARIDALDAKAKAFEAALAAAKPQKVPHLVAVDTGADFGPFAGWDRYFNVDVGEYVALGQFPVSFFSLDCTGEGFIESFASPATATLAYATGPDGTLLRLGPRNKPGQVQSQRLRSDNGVRCEASSGFSNGRTFTDTGVGAPGLSASQLRIELR